jgi:hypothetical protein
MFWGSFSYNYKGPCHIYYSETKDEKAKYQDIIDQYNTVLLLQKQAEWACLQATDILKWQRLNRKKPGVPVTWEVFWKKNIIKREKGKGGINYMRY